MNDYLEQFINHEFLIYITNASEEALKELDSILADIISIPTPNASDIYKHHDHKHNIYLHVRNDHCNRGKKILTYSSNPIDVFNNKRCMPFVTLDEFLSRFSKLDVTEDEINRLFGGLYD